MLAPGAPCTRRVVAPSGSWSALHANPVGNNMGVPRNWGPFCGRPENASPTIWSLIRPLLFGRDTNNKKQEHTRTHIPTHGNTLAHVQLRFTCLYIHIHTQAHRCLLHIVLTHTDICSCTQILLHIYTLMLHTSTHLQNCMCIYIYTDVYRCAHAHARTYTCTHKHVHTHTHMRIHTCIDKCIYICLHIHTHRYIYICKYIDTYSIHLYIHERTANQATRQRLLKQPTNYPTERPISQ